MVKERSKKITHVPELAQSSGFAFDSFNFRTILLVVIGLVFYSNSIFNEYALDDGIVIEKNSYVQEGFRGIPKILSSDAYESFYKQMNASQQLSGGRYRPFSLVTFAIEQQLFGSKEKEKPKTDIATIRHFVNVALYIFSVLALFYFLLNYVFKNKPNLAFLTALIFLIHPLHTEVVANVKSRDEIFSFLFIILTFIYVFKYEAEKRIGQLVAGASFYFLALLSKEYAITLIALIPMILYIVKGETFMKSLFKSGPYFLVALIYLMIRIKVVGKGATTPNSDVLNNPYMYATANERLATMIDVLNHYLRLLFFPHPLSSDYSYSTIPYTNFKNPLVWSSIAIHISMIIATIVLFFKRNILAFALAFYLMHLMLVTNFVFDVGATMGERLVYHSSFGFAICIACFIYWLMEKQSQAERKKVILIGFTVIVTVLSAIVVIPRNADWKSDNTLFIKDAETVPNSALVNGNAGKVYVDLSEMPENKSREKELIQKAIVHLNRSVTIHTKYVNGYLNLGVCYFKLKDYDNAEKNWKKVEEIFPNNPYLKRNYAALASAYYNKAMTYGPSNPTMAILYLNKAVEKDSSNANYWYDLGGANFTIKNYEEARRSWTKTLEILPNHEQAKKGLMAIPAK